MYGIRSVIYITIISALLQ